jgi:hypothetical protein
VRIDEYIEGIRRPIALAPVIIAPVFDFASLYCSYGAIRACSDSRASSRLGGISLPSGESVPLYLSAEG